MKNGPSKRPVFCGADETKGQFIAWFDAYWARASRASCCDNPSILTFSVPAPRMPSAAAAAYDRSMIRPRAYGPRSLIFTTTVFWLAVFVTRTHDAERQRAVSRGERVHVVAFAAGGLAAVERTAVPGGTTLLLEVADARAVRDRLRIGERGSLGRLGGRRRRRVQRRFVGERRHGPGTVIAKEVVPWVLIGGAQVAGTRRGTASQDCNGKETPNLSSKSNIHRRVYQRLSSRLAPRKNARVVAAQGFSAQCSAPFDRCERRADARVRRTSPQTPG